MLINAELQSHDNTWNNALIWVDSGNPDCFISGTHHHLFYNRRACIQEKTFTDTIMLRVFLFPGWLEVLHIIIGNIPGIATIALHNVNFTILVFGMKKYPAILGKTRSTS